MAKDTDRTGQVLARLIIEMLGAPKEHVETTLKDFVKMLKQDRDLEVVSEEFAEPDPKEGLFSTFVEIEIWFKNLPRLLNFCFEAMPSSVEILEPEVIYISAPQLSGYLNDLQARLHTLDMELKRFEAERTVLGNNADALFRNLVMLSLKHSQKSLNQLSTDLGIKPDELKPLLDQLVERASIKFNNGNYFSERNEEP